MKRKIQINGLKSFKKWTIYRHSKHSMRVYSKIKNFIDERKISKDGLAEKAGIGRSTIFNWLKRQSGMSIEDLEKLSDALGVPPAYWWTDDENSLTNPDTPMNTISREDHERMISFLEDQISYLKEENSFLRSQIDPNFKSKTVS